MKKIFTVLSFGIMLAVLVFTACNNQPGISEPHQAVIESANSINVAPISSETQLNAISKIVATYSQTIQIVDKITGKPVSGVKISVSDNSACYLPQTAGTDGCVTFKTKGIQTIFASRSGYSNYIVSPQMSFSTFKITLNPLPTKPKSNSILSVTKANAADLLTLAKTLGIVRPLGRFSLKQINTALGYASAFDVGICLLTPAAGTPPCYAADIIVGLASTAGFLAVQIGVSENQLFDFYLVNFGTQQVLMIPVK